MSTGGSARGSSAALVLTRACTCMASAASAFSPRDLHVRSSLSSVALTQNLILSSRNCPQFSLLLHPSFMFAR